MRWLAEAARAPFALGRGSGCFQRSGHVDQSKPVSPHARRHSFEQLGHNDISAAVL